MKLLDENLLNKKVDTHIHKKKSVKQIHYLPRVESKMKVEVTLKLSVMPSPQFRVSLYIHEIRVGNLLTPIVVFNIYPYTQRYTASFCRHMIYICQHNIVLTKKKKRTIASRCNNRLDRGRDVRVNDFHSYISGKVRR